MTKTKPKREKIQVTRTKKKNPPSKIAKKDNRKPPQRNSDNRMVSAWVDKKVAHQLKLEAAKLNMNQSDFIRFVIQEALENEKLKPPMKAL